MYYAPPRYGPSPYYGPHHHHYGPPPHHYGGGYGYGYGRPGVRVHTGCNVF